MDVIDHFDSPQTWVRKIVQGTDRLVSINIGDTWLENGHYIYQLWYLAFVFYHRTYTYCLIVGDGFFFSKIMHVF